MQKLKIDGGKDDEVKYPEALESPTLGSRPKSFMNKSRQRVDSAEKNNERIEWKGVGAKTVTDEMA